MRLLSEFVGHFGTQVGLITEITFGNSWAELVYHVVSAAKVDTLQVRT